VLNQKHCKPAKLIVCTLARGQSRSVLEVLQQTGHVLASEYISIRSQNNSHDDHKWDDMDSLRIMVAPQYAENIFEMLYHLVEIETHEGVYMFQMNVPWVTHFELPDIPPEGVAIPALHHGAVLPAGVSEETAKILRKLANID